MAKRILLKLCGVAMTLVALPAQSATIQVTIEKLEFKPAQIVATVGDTIEWVNNDIMVHSATADGVFDVVTQPHKTASIQMTKDGTFDYYCRFHPNMRARIEVQPK
jgi:plastocyanin